jgi:putative transposase
MLTVIDEYTRRCLAIVVARRLRSDDVLHCLTELIVAHGPPEHIRTVHPGPGCPQTYLTAPVQS